MVKEVAFLLLGHPVGNSARYRCAGISRWPALGYGRHAVWIKGIMPPGLGRVIRLPV